MANTKNPSVEQNNLIYVHEMLGELRRVAETQGADMLCYLIEMAYIETGDLLANGYPSKKPVEDNGDASSSVSL